jgi:hypothetical protein
MSYLKYLEQERQRSRSFTKQVTDDKLYVVKVTYDKGETFCFDRGYYIIGHIERRLEGDIFEWTSTESTKYYKLGDASRFKKSELEMWGQWAEAHLEMFFNELAVNDKDNCVTETKTA